MNDVEQRLRAALAEAVPDADPVELEPIAHRVRRRRQAWSAGAAAAAVLAIATTAAIVAGQPRGNEPIAGPSTEATPTATASTCPPTGKDAATLQIDYIDFVRFGGREYIGEWTPARALPTVLIGQRVGTVSCTISQIKPAVDYRSKDGDAAFLPAGTPLYAVRGYPASARLAAPRDGEYVLYEAKGATAVPDTNPFTVLRGKVKQIEVLNLEGHVLGDVTNKATVDELVTALATTKLRNVGKPSGAKERYVQFVLTDGSVTWAWDPAKANLGGMMTLPASANAVLTNIR